MKGGYGHFWLDGKHIGAHRQAYIWENGPIPEGLEPDHTTCNNPPCVRPAHMELVTHAENIRRAMALADSSTWGKPHAGKTRCPQGHDYDEANTYIDPRGARRCRACRRT
jgi:hypothetical protein